MDRNNLDRETSPYLLQHADNPVHWQAWSPDALTAARDANRPILLSIGYAACHWCHVMAHESFEDQATADLMNALFVNIKVDREERPDLDAIYQHALALTGEHGGWPLTMFLTPDGQPFWGGTYFPPGPRYGRPGFPDVLRAVADHYHSKPDQVAQAATALHDALTGMSRSNPGGLPPLELNDQAAARLAQEIDPVHGGIRGAPKFPNPSILELLWRAHRRTGDERCGAMVHLTLDHMSQGGIYDHLGGGFARYSTDETWLVPHFEKMLYDNAQLLHLLTAAWQASGSSLYRSRIEETVGWVQREMIAEGGGFAATLDADSEGEEGKYYVWTADEIAGALGPDAETFMRVYDVAPPGNWEHHTILHRNHAHGAIDDTLEPLLARCRQQLFRIRNERVRPGWDDKILADWNGMMIAALANASAALDRPEWLETAVTAFRFVTETMLQSGRLLHSSRRGRARHAATLDDYANMARAALTLHESTGEPAYLDHATTWIDVLDEHYLDHERGGYYFTADDAEALIVRSKTAADNATPSGNGVVAEVLARLHYITGDDRYRLRAEETISAFSGEAERNIFPLASLLNASEFLQRAHQIVIIGPRDDPAAAALVRAARTAPTPTRVLTRLASADNLPPSHPAAGKTAPEGQSTAYVCIGQTCSLPIAEPEALAQTLAAA